MFRIDSSGVSASLPTPAALGATSGYFQDGTGVTPTIVTADWANAVQEEIVAVIAQAGIALDKTNRAQLLAALNQLYVRPLVILQDQKTQNTAGGTFSSGAWRTRDLNTKVLDTASICTLSSNQFTLPAGQYLVTGRAPAVNVDPHQARLWNVTDGALLVSGSSENASGSGATDFIQTSSVIEGAFTLTGTKTIQLQHQCTASQTGNGFGFACNFGPEVYSYLGIRKIA